MSRHMQREIDKLKRQIVGLGRLVDSAVSSALKVVTEQDRERANQVIKGDREIDRKEVELEEECLKILALHQPVAVDLRFIVAVLKINNDLERVGDLASSIAKRGARLLELGETELPTSITQMFKKTKRVYRESLRALVKLDTGVAREVLLADDEIDRLNAQVHEWVREQLKVHPDKAEELTLLMSMAKHLERIADLASNIAEDVIYMVEGDIIRHGLHSHFS